MRDVITFIFLVIFATAVGVGYWVTETQSVKPAPAVDDESPACTAVAHVGMQNVWRCDDEETGARCYVNTTGFLFCLD